MCASEHSYVLACVSGWTHACTCVRVSMPVHARMRACLPACVFVLPVRFCTCVRARLRACVRALMHK